MFVDASVLVAIMLREPEALRFGQAIEDAEFAVTSPIAVFETLMALFRVGVSSRAAKEDVAALLSDLRIGIAPITAEIGERAVEAFEKYGKGRGHNAQLNMGDCFSYACAKSLGVPLLYKGTDFARTDLA